MKYKVGDRVRVRSNLVVNKAYGDYCFIEDMVRFKDKEFRICYVYDDCYELVNIPYYWTDGMLEPVVTMNIKPQELFDFLGE